MHLLLDNLLIGRRPGGLVIDHVLVRGFAGTSAARRVLDRAAPLTGEGAPRVSPPSDHYGVSVTLAPASSIGSAPGAGPSPR